MEALRKRLGNRLHAIILYGSVARGDAGIDSDVDLLVVTDAKFGYDTVSDLAYEIDFAARFTTFLTPLEFSPQQLEHYMAAGDPFLERVLAEGKILYDDGTSSSRATRRARVQSEASRVPVKK